MDDITPRLLRRQLISEAIQNVESGFRLSAIIGAIIDKAYTMGKHDGFEEAKRRVSNVFSEGKK